MRDMSKKNLRISSVRCDDETTRKQIIKMLIYIIAIFFLSWSPLTINNLLVSFKILPNVNHGILWYLRISFFVLSYVNSCVNPIVYSFMSKNFREAFRHIIGKVLNLWKKAPQNVSHKFNTQENKFEIKSSSESQEQAKSLICGTSRTQISNCI